MADGTVRKITISDKKPIGALFEAIIEQEGRAVYSLFKGGIEIPRSREMIKYVPLKNGDVLSEGAEVKTKNIPIASYQDSILRSQVKRGIVKQEDVMEIKIISRDGKVILVLVKRTATVNDLKKAVSELLGREVKELVFRFREPGTGIVYLGWSGTMQNSLSRVYNGNLPLTNFDVVDQTILDEVLLPKTIQEIEKERRDKEERERQEKKLREEAARREEEEYRRYQEYWRRQHEPREEPAPPRENSKEEKCRKLLAREGIVDKSTFLRWALGNHPDKFSSVPSDEKERITEKFQVVNACVDLLNIKSIKSKDGGRRTRKGKKRVRRGRSRKN
jgi:hypothetical protein